MASNTAPEEDEVDRFVELYEEIGTVKGVAEHEDVDWSRPTVSKWLKRRGVTGDGDSGDDEEDTATPEPEPTVPDEEGRYEATDEGNEIGVDGDPSNLLPEPKTPNEILFEVLDRDPKLNDDVIAYIKQFESEYGQLSPSNVTDLLNDLSINNKRQTIGRVSRHYSNAINRRLRENPDLQYDERWATLLTKVTGDNSYIRNAQKQQHEQQIGGIQPPSPTQGAGGGPAAGGSGAQGITPPAGGQPSQQGQGSGIQPPQPQQNGAAQAQQPQQSAPQQPGGQGGQQEGLSPFEERLIGMLEEQMDNGQQQQVQQEPQDPTDQISQLINLQQQLEELQGAAQNGDGAVDEQVEQIAEQVDTRLSRLESQVTQAAGQQQQRPAPSGGGDDDSMFGDVARLAEQVDDPDVLNMLLEMKTDPEVLEAQAKRKEVENNTEWKKSLAESVSPAAAEKAIDAFLNLSSGLSQRANQAQQPQQAQQQRPPQQEPQPAQPEPQQEQERSVEMVDEGSQERTKPANPMESADMDTSPLREEGEAELESESTESDTTEEDEE